MSVKPLPCEFPKSFSTKTMAAETPSSTYKSKYQFTKNLSSKVLAATPVIGVFYHYHCQSYLEDAIKCASHYGHKKECLEILHLSRNYSLLDGLSHLAQTAALVTLLVTGILTNIPVVMGFVMAAAFFAGNGLYSAYQTSRSISKVSS